MATVTYDAATCVYDGADRLAVDALELDVTDGEFLVLVGASPPSTSPTTRPRP